MAAITASAQARVMTLIPVGRDPDENSSKPGFGRSPGLKRDPMMSPTIDPMTITSVPP
ncbi:MAG: hypothetical protein LBQ12_13245 [Deltaproteobacteria bacterium]|nr:hypothetical protein [Deltaproteobacteria bacterium]